jgi:copper(I)-binding protein
MRSALVSFLFFAAACGAPQTHAPAEAATAATLAVSDAWVRPTPGGVDVSAGYLTIANPTGSEDRLVAVSSPRARRMEVHAMSMENGVMRMQAVEGGVAVPPGGAVTLGPGGLHLMFIGVTQPFVEGETIPVTLTFAHAGDVAVELPVRRTGHSAAH